MDDVSPIEVASFETVDKDFTGCDIGCNRNAVHIAKAKQVDIVGFVGLAAERISEKEQEIDLVIAYSCSNLLGTAGRSGHIFLYRKTGCLFYNFTGSTGSTQRMSAENAAVCNAKLNHQFFFRVVRNQRNIHKTILSAATFFEYGTFSLTSIGIITDIPSFSLCYYYII